MLNNKIKKIVEKGGIYNYDDIKDKIHNKSFKKGKYIKNDKFAKALNNAIVGIQIKSKKNTMMMI
jgi:hypothetical protein